MSLISETTNTILSGGGVSGIVVRDNDNLPGQRGEDLFERLFSEGGVAQNTCHFEATATDRRVTDWFKNAFLTKQEKKLIRGRFRNFQLAHLCANQQFSFTHFLHALITKQSETHSSTSETFKITYFRAFVARATQF